ncbi:phosphohistidine phosphatase SixA [Parendozoicomonas sp. Alg238-R29]|uniref:phosphohistidine phosphatase SixA n=1 Tax=Parendozoicomonas sp. Alg238-R29 TaxID=2993446 RepID=UPI00248D7303|nr:phosphohistidine phosphatase SixA [Parendozoicomonas sp. Alg238-R29]
MKLYIMRHGQAEYAAPSDELRPLSESGQEQARKVAEQLRDIPFSGILASPYLRAQQTAETVRSVISGPGITTTQSIVPEAVPNIAVDQLPDQGNWLLVAHMPLVGKLTSLLVDGVVSADVPYSTAMVCELEMELPGPGMAYLQRIFTP